jgi:hypothetical protein
MSRKIVGEAILLFGSPLLLKGAQEVDVSDYSVIDHGDLFDV